MPIEVDHQAADDCAFSRSEQIRVASVEVIHGSPNRIPELDERWNGILPEVAVDRHPSRTPINPEWSTDWPLRCRHTSLLR
ncbi:hypothetical protein ACH4T9_05180 [Micromonospora sp. NPDC020750]|uniref:hypothetical protein n=1 Tax=unclassified Micromonospora TaxID=2617518 RepID=UPI003790F687